MNESRPLWTPTIGKHFTATVLGMDHRLNQYVLLNRSERPIECIRGPIDDPTSVMVDPGHEFTMHTYAALKLEQYMNEEIRVVATNERTLPPSHGHRERKFWEFAVYITPESKERLDAIVSIREHRTAVRALISILLEQTVPAGDLREMIKDVRRAISTGNKPMLYPEGFLGAYANKLSEYLLGYDKDFDPISSENETE